MSSPPPPLPTSLSPTNTSLPPAPFTFPSFSLSNGLVEIAALTTLIGSKNAESLSLGSRGAAGLVWATMSTFGALSVVKACLAGSTPEVLRETFGLRNEATDGAVGLGRDLRRGKGLERGAGMVRERRELGAVVGVGVGGTQVCALWVVVFR